MTPQELRDEYSEVELKLLAHPRFSAWYSVHDRHFVRISAAPGERVRFKSIEGDSPEKAAALALITMRITQ